MTGERVKRVKEPEVNVRYLGTSIPVAVLG